MPKNRNNRKVHIPGSNSGAVRIPSSKKDPNVAPTGAAFSTEDAVKHAEAVFKGVQQVLAVMGIRGFFMQIIVPIVEWRKDITMPDGTKKDDFMMTGQGINPAICSAGQDPVAIAASKSITPMLWKTAFNADLTSGGDSPAKLPDVGPAPENN